MPFYPSKHVDPNLAVWLEAKVAQYDTHVVWDATIATRRDGSPDVVHLPFFKDYACSSEVFLDWMKRGIIGSEQRISDARVMKCEWSEVEETREALKPYIVFHSSDEGKEHSRKYREPKRGLWYEAIVNVFINDEVHFSLSLWGYKYRLEDLTISKDAFYILTDRLNARTRFTNSWTSLDEPMCALTPLLTCEILKDIRPSLECELKRLLYPTEEVINAAIRNLTPLLERLLRNIACERGWSGTAKNLDRLIVIFDEKKVIQDNTKQLLRLVSKPYRDHVTHGYRLALPVARVVLVSILDVFARVVIDVSTASKGKF